MQILVAVNQSESLRRGINAPSSTAKLEVDPASLSQSERDCLAEHLYEGHDASGRGSIPALRAPTPDLAGLREAISAAIADKVRREAEAEQARAEADRKIDEAITAPSVEHREISLRDDGSIAIGVGGISVEIELPAELPYWLPFEGSEQGKARYRARAKAIAAERAAAIQAALPALREQLVAKQAAAAAKKTEYQDLHARLPTELVRRAEAGYAGKHEVANALRALLLRDAGLPDLEWEDEEPLTVLTPDQFAALRRVQAPAGAKTEALRVWDRELVPCDEHDKIEADCDDCAVERKNERTVVAITWSRGGIDVTTGVNLDHAPELTAVAHSPGAQGE